MIRVELHEAPEGPGDYHVVASLEVDDDGTYRVDDPGQKLLTDLTVLVKDPAAPRGMRKVALEEDPAAWARNLKTLHRTGYWVPVIVRDDQADQEGTSNDA